MTGVAQNNTSVLKRTLFFSIKNVEMSFCRAVEKPPGYPPIFLEVTNIQAKLERE